MGYVQNEIDFKHYPSRDSNLIIILGGWRM